MFLDPQKHALIDNDVETFLGSHSREKCVYKGKCVSTLIKGKHDTWLARRLTTYKYENENACLDKNLHQFFFSLSRCVAIIKPCIYIGHLIQFLQ
jgi:hypothetical protein